MVRSVHRTPPLPGPHRVVTKTPTSAQPGTPAVAMPAPVTALQSIPGLLRPSVAVAPVGVAASGLVDRMLQLQRQVGNTVVQRLLRSEYDHHGAVVPDTNSFTTPPIESVRYGRPLMAVVSRDLDPKAEAERVAKLGAAYEEKVKQGDLANAAVYLNAYNNDDILVQLKKLSSIERRGMYFAAATWITRVRDPIAAMDPRVTEHTAVTDAQLDQIQKKYPTGVTVALYAQYDYGDAATKSNNQAFLAESTRFAANEGAVGVSGGNVALGIPIPIKEVSEVIVVVQSIHRGLVEKWQQAQKQAAGDKPPATSEPPAFTRIRNLALFAHGMPWGIGMDEKNAFKLHSDQKGLNPPNVKSFVSGLSGVLTSDVRVQLFACNAALGEKDPQEWGKPGQGGRKGDDSFAASLAGALGPDASVYAHTAAAHTTELTSARVFGKDAGGGAGGIHIFDLLYDEPFVQSELGRIFPDSADRTALHDSLRSEMWLHYQSQMYDFKDVAQPDGTTKKQGVPKTYGAGQHTLGQEQFTHIDQAKVTLHKDWTDLWIKAPEHIARVKPKAAPAAVQRAVQRLSLAAFPVTAGVAVQREPSFKDMIDGKAQEVRTKIAVGDFVTPFHILNGLWIRDTINTLQQLNKTGDLDKLIANFGSAPGFTQPRIGMAINAVKPFPAGVAKAREFETAAAQGTPAEQEAFKKLQQEFGQQRLEVEGFLDVRKWPDLLSRSGQPASATDKKKQDIIVDFVGRQRALINENLGLRLVAFAGRTDAGYNYNGTPGTDAAPNLSNADARREHVNRVVWQEVAGEGSSASINTYDGANSDRSKDKANLTWGRGFLSGGQLGEKMGYLFQRDPSVRDILLDAGFTFRSGQWLAVNTSTGLVEVGPGALELVRFDKKILSLLIEIGEDPAHKQNVVDAEWDTVAHHAGGVPQAVVDQNWSDEAIAFAAHCVHWGSSWSSFVGTGGNITSMIRVMAPHVAREKVQPGGSIVTNAVSTGTFLGFARLGTATGAIQRNNLLQGPGPLPADITGTPPAYAGHIFFHTHSDTYYHLAP